MQVIFHIPKKEVASEDTNEYGSISRKTKAEDF